MSTRTFRSRACTSRATCFEKLGGEVTERIYPGMGHTVNADEIGHVTKLLAGLGAIA